MSDKTIWELELHEEYRNGVEVLRVPGGWIYSFKGLETSTFVPYSEEFKGKE